MCKESASPVFQKDVQNVFIAHPTKKTKKKSLEGLPALSISEPVSTYSCFIHPSPCLLVIISSLQNGHLWVWSFWEISKCHREKRIHMPPTTSHTHKNKNKNLELEMKQPNEPKRK